MLYCLQTIPVRLARALHQAALAAGRQADLQEFSEEFDHSDLHTSGRLVELLQQLAGMNLE